MLTVYMRTHAGIHADWSSKMNKNERIDNLVKLVKKELRLIRQFNEGKKELLQEIISVKEEINSNYSKAELNLARDKILVMAICPRDAYKSAEEDEKQ